MLLDYMTDFEDYCFIFVIIFICLHLLSLHSEAVPVPSNARYKNFQGRSFEHDVGFELFCVDIRIVSSAFCHQEFFFQWREKDHLTASSPSPSYKSSWCFGSYYPCHARLCKRALPNKHRVLSSASFHIYDEKKVCFLAAVRHR